MKPKVSVIIPAHGGAHNLTTTLDSVVSQTYANTEIVVVDYGSKNDDMAKSVAATYGNNVVFYKKECDSIADALNFGATKLTGHYVSWLSPGDVYDAHRLDKLVELADDTGATISVSDWTVVNRNGRKIRDYVVDNRLEKYPGSFLAFAREIQLNTCAMLIPAELLRNVGLFDGLLPPAQDYGMLARLVASGARFKTINQPLLRYESRSAQEATVNYDSTHSDVINTLSYDDIIDYFGSRENALEHYREMLGAALPRSASFLMDKIIKGSITVDGREVAKRLLLDDLSVLNDSQMATDANALVSKIAEPTNKKKIMFCSAHWLTGGMERVLTTLFRELRDDYEIFLITPYDARKSYIAVPDFVTSIKISDELFVGHFDSLALSYALLLDIDVAVGFVNLFDKQLNLYKLCVGTKIKTIASNHEYYFYPYKSPIHYHVVEKRLSAYQACNAIVWPTVFNAALCGMYAENNYVIGNPNNFEITQATSSSRENVIICVGRFNDYVKRIDRILECFSLVLEAVPDAKLVIVGKHDNDAPIRPDDRATVNSIIDDLDIPSDRLRFIGEVDNVQDYYNQAKVLLLTSNSEGFGMVLNEAACFGVPSVCNYIPGVEDIIQDGENGYITAQGDLRSMASRVSDILTNNELHKYLSDTAKKKVTAYDSRHIGDKWRYLISSLLSTNDAEALRRKLNAKLGYSIKDHQLFSKVLAEELNDIFYLSIHGRGQHEIMSGPLLLLSKVIGFPKRLKANIEYEGLGKTIAKVVTRSFRIIRNKLKR